MQALYRGVSGGTPEAGQCRCIQVPGRELLGSFRYALRLFFVNPPLLASIHKIHKTKIRIEPGRDSAYDDQIPGKSIERSGLTLPNFVLQRT
jgi:hypothetical protein